MAKNERQRQQKLAQKAARRNEKQRTSRRQLAEIASGNSLIRQFAVAAGLPVHEALIASGLAESGIGYAVLSRRLPTGQIVVAAFLVDVWCLGVKNALANALPEYEYRRLIQQLGERQRLSRVSAECVRKLVEDAVAYARDLGFDPHPDYRLASQIFGEVDAGACSTTFEFGKDGKPFYASGPYESVARSRRIVDTLLQRCGPDGFHYLIGSDDPFALDLTEEDLERLHALDEEFDDDEDEDDEGGEDVDDDAPRQLPEGGSQAPASAAIRRPRPFWAWKGRN